MIRRDREIVRAAIYVLPSFLLLFVFTILPIGMNIFYSLTKYNVIQKPLFVGLSNFITIFTKDINFRVSLKNTVLFTIITVPLNTFLPLIMAAILAEWFQNRFGGFVRGTLFIPHLASSVLVGTLWIIFLTSRGPVNMLLGLFGIKPIAFLGKTETALFTVSMVYVWKGIGYYLVICYAGIMDIPRSLYEAARVDGAGTIQRFFYITLPSMASIIYLLITLGIIWSFQVFDLIFIMTGGGPGFSSQTLVYTIYMNGFKQYNMGYASAQALVLLVIVLVISIIQRRLQRDGGEG